MGNAAIGYRDLLNEMGVSISATNAIPTLPAENLRGDHVSTVFRASTLTTVINVDFGAAQEVGMVFFAGIRSGATAFSTFTLSAGTSPGASNIAFFNVPGQAQYGFDAVFRQAVFVLPAAATARYWRLVLTQAGGDLLEIGRLFLSPLLPLAVNIGYPFTTRPEPRSQRFDSAGAEPTIYKRKTVREATISLEGTLATQDDIFGQCARVLDVTAGDHSPVAVVPDRTTGNSLLDVRSALYGHLTDLGEASWLTLREYGRRYRIREAG
ncbi:MAG: hypothetical protein AAGG47_18210 [Pseudomonadota bacterium]